MIRGINIPSYLDIGAYHPFKFRNTAIFYLKVAKCVNIEPNPNQYKYFQTYRKKDVNLNIDIGAENGILTYFLMNEPTMNTFDKSSMIDLVQNHGFKLKEKMDLPVMNLATIIQKYCNGIFPDFLSLDVEGLDEMILKLLN